MARESHCGMTIHLHDAEPTSWSFCNHDDGSVSITFWFDQHELCINGSPGKLTDIADQLLTFIDKAQQKREQANAGCNAQP